jgi:hypothetical protein
MGTFSAASVIIDDPYMQLGTEPILARCSVVVGWHVPVDAERARRRRPGREETRRGHARTRATIGQGARADTSIKVKPTGRKAGTTGAELAC